MRGYGEQALVELVTQRGKPQLPGVTYAGGFDDATRAEVALESLPSPLLDGTIPLQSQRFVRWETQRGCPFRCAFCQHRQPGARLVRSALDEGRILAEVDMLCAAGVEDIAVLDPIFNGNPAAVALLERFARNGYRGRLSLQLRAEMITTAFLDAAAKLDTKLEFGLQTIHTVEQRAIRRGNNLAKVDEVLAEVRKRGLSHEVSLIFGLPEQTLESFIASVDWCLERGVPVIKAFPLLLLRGTALELDRKRWDLQTTDDAGAMVISSSTFDADEWRAMEQISAALQQTEGCHPRRVVELPIAADQGPLWDRWKPRRAA